MSGLFSIGLGIGAIFILIIFLTGKGRVLFSGFVNLFFDNVAKTKEGAEAIYSQAIEKAQNNYNTASDVLNKLSGALYTAEQNLESIKKEVTKTKEKMKQSAQQGLMDNVDLYGEQLTTLEEKLSLYEEQIAKTKPMVSEAKLVTQETQKELKKLIAEKEITIQKIILNQQQTKMYDQLDVLKNTDGVSKLLNSVRTQLQDSTERAVGAKIVHGEKLETKLLVADNKLKTGGMNSYAQELKAQYGKQQNK